MSSELQLPLSYKDETLSDKSLQEFKSQILESVKNILRKCNCSHALQTLHFKVYTIVKQMHGQQLYYRLSHLIEHHCKITVRKNILDNFNVNFLRSVVQAWEDHKTAMVIIMDIFIYLDRAIVQYKEDGSVYNMGIRLFLNHVIRYERIKDHLSDTLLALIAEDRKDGHVDTILIKRTCTMLSSLGHNGKCVYFEYFERPFVLQSVRYFQETAHQLLSTEDCNISDYLNKVEKFIIEEEFRACLCLQQSTKFAVIKVIKSEMLENNLKLIIGHERTGLIYMLINEKWNDLKLMFKMLSPVNDGVRIIAEYLSKYLRDTGKLIVEKYGKGISPIDFIQNIVDLLEKTNNCLKTCFDQDPTLCKQIYKDCEYIINLDAKTPCYLAKYCNNILSKYSDELLEHGAALSIDKALKLFRSLQEKDLFEELYRQLMARRLLDSKFITEEVEKTVISKLEFECGTYFTHKMKNMLKDLTLSTLETEEYEKQKCGTCPLTDMKFHVNILASGFWPFPVYPNSCTFPPDVYSSFKQFSRFYVSRHMGRKLILQPDFGTADLLVTFHTTNVSVDQQPKQTEKILPQISTILHVSTYQMCVLMLFNENEKLTFNEIKCKTNISDKNLQSALEPLFKAKYPQCILLKEEGLGESSDECTFTVNKELILNQKEIKIQPVCTTDEIETDEKRSRETVALDRKDEIDLVVVRIMKKMKVMRHVDLIEKVTELLIHRFTPSPLLIKNRIEGLIDRDYIERLKDDMQTYRYIA